MRGRKRSDWICPLTSTLWLSAEQALELLGKRTADTSLGEEEDLLAVVFLLDGVLLFVIVTLLLFLELLLEEMFLSAVVAFADGSSFPGTRLVALCWKETIEN
jgi:hypothetical protein